MRVYFLCKDQKRKVFYGGIAQLVRALASHARGRRFESYCPYQLLRLNKAVLRRFFLRGFLISSLQKIIRQISWYKKDFWCEKHGTFDFLYLFMVLYLA